MFVEGGEIYLSGEEGWCSGESTRLPPMWRGIDSRTRRHMWVEFAVGSLLCSERFFPSVPVMPSPQKPTLLNSNSIRIAGSIYQFKDPCSSSRNGYHNKSTAIIIKITSAKRYSILLTGFGFSSRGTADGPILSLL